MSGFILRDAQTGSILRGLGGGYRVFKSRQRAARYLISARGRGIYYQIEANNIGNKDVGL